MLKPKKKLNIKTEVQDVLEGLTPWKRFQAYWEVNQKQISYIGIAIVVVVAGGIFWFNRQTEGAKEAALELSRIQSYYDAGQYQKAVAGDSVKTIRGQQIKGLKEIVDEYGSTTPGKIASLYLANCYYYLGQYDNAKEYYSKAESNSDPVFEAAAYAGEGAVLESKNQYDEAEKYYERASKQSDNNPNNPDYMIAAARCLANMSQTNKAIELYKRVVYQFAGTTSEETAKHAIAELHGNL
ncbi:MAG TPA: tetratricopeptide repeat protein [Candidatus Kapabacteria bacterium]|nr:tetratricopeptide repeat protein [Candidatus Kapabacteria bacterium]